MICVFVFTEHAHVFALLALGLFVFSFSFLGNIDVVTSLWSMLLNWKFDFSLLSLALASSSTCSPLSLSFMEIEKIINILRFIYPRRPPTYLVPETTLIFFEGSTRYQIFSLISKGLSTRAKVKPKSRLFRL